MTRRSPLHDRSSYNFEQARSPRSARKVVPFLCEALKPISERDLGCGVGSWLRVFRECDVTDVVGVDGHCVDESEPAAA
jgi:hypothetical protein